MNTYKAWIPLKAPTVNTLYEPIWWQRRMRLSNEVLLFKTQFKRYLPPWQDAPKTLTLFHLYREFHGDWWFKNGKPRKSDLDNLEKCTQDALAEQLGFDDSLIWSKATKKVHSEKYGILIQLSKFEA